MKSPVPVRVDGLEYIVSPFGPGPDEYPGMAPAEPIALSDAAEQRLQVAFAPEERREARRMLVYECGAGIEHWGSDPSAYDRLRLAAMKASQGRIEGLRWAIAMAQKDWRDLLVHAGFADNARAHERWLVPGSEEAVLAERRWLPRDLLAGSALRGVPGIVIAPAQRHSEILGFSIHGVSAHEFVHGLLTALKAGERVMLPDPGDDCGRYVRAVPGGWQTQLICHGRFGDPWHDADRDQAFAWLLPAAEAMVADPRIEGDISPRPEDPHAG